MTADLDAQIVIPPALAAAFESWAQVAEIVSTSTSEEASRSLRELLGTTEVGVQQVLNTQLRRVTLDEQSHLRSHLQELQVERAGLDGN